MKKVENENKKNDTAANKWQEVSGYKDLLVSVRNAYTGKDGKLAFIPFEMCIIIDDDMTVYLYGCKVIPHEGGYFIGFSSRQGGDGKYYNNCYAKMGDDLRDAVIAQVTSIAGVR